MTALELSDLLDRLGAGDLYHATMMGTDGSLAVEWVTSETTTYGWTTAASEAAMTTLLMEKIADIRCTAGTQASVARKSERSDDDTEPMFSVAGGAGMSPNMWPASAAPGSDSLEIDFDLVKRDVSECRAKYCTECGAECKWIELLSSKVWGCPKC